MQTQRWRETLTFAPKKLTHHLEKGRFGSALRPEANLQGLKAGPPGMAELGLEGRSVTRSQKFSRGGVLQTALALGHSVLF